MRILVTGGAGFIGSNVVDAFMASGHEVAVFDDLSTGRREFVHPRARFFEASLVDAAAVDQAVGEFRPEVVDHHAQRLETRLRGRLRPLGLRRSPAPFRDRPDRAGGLRQRVAGRDQVRLRFRGCLAVHFASNCGATRIVHC